MPGGSFQARARSVSGALALGLWVLATSCAGPAADTRSAGQRARGLLARGDTAAAISLLSSQKLDTPDTVDLSLLLGTLYRTRGTIAARLRSQHVLERALQMHPNDNRVMLALARTYFAQRFFPDAVRCFRTALARDPTLCSARYALGCYYFDKWLRVNSYTDDLETARDFLADVTVCDSTRFDAERRYLISLYVLGDSARAARECRRALRRFPGRAELYLYRGALAYDMHRTTAAQADFDTALTRMPSSWKDAFLNLKRVVSLEGADDIAAMPAAKQSRFERAYWLRADPDPTTTTNERFVEHVYRTYLSDVYFAVSYPPIHGWNTERGETYIKFGKPDRIARSMGSGSTNGRDEVWTYGLQDQFLQFVFVDERLNGNMRVPLSQDFRLAFVRHSNRQSTWKSPTAQIPGDFEVIAFRDDDFHSTVYTALRIDADSLAHAVDLKTFDHFVYRSAFFDEDWEADTTMADTSWTGDIARGREGGRTVFNVVHAITRPFARYHVCCAFEDEHATARLTARRDVSTEEFVGGKLSLSHILLYDDTIRLGAVVERHGHQFSPHTGQRYGDDDVLRVYLEIYELSKVGAQASYNITWAIFPDGGKRSRSWKRWGKQAIGLLGIGQTRQAVISQTFARTSSAYSADEEIAIDIAKLKPGLYDLVVTVADNRSGQHASRTTHFTRLAGQIARNSSAAKVPN